VENIKIKNYGYFLIKLIEKFHINKVLYNKLEYGGKSEGTCFIGISNYSWNAAKINRIMSLSVPNLEDKFEKN